MNLLWFHVQPYNITLILSFIRPNFIISIILSIFRVLDFTNSDLKLNCPVIQTTFFTLG